jgi:hypothetical protein
MCIEGNNVSEFSHISVFTVKALNGNVHFKWFLSLLGTSGSGERIRRIIVLIKFVENRIPADFGRMHTANFRKWYVPRTRVWFSLKFLILNKPSFKLPVYDFQTMIFSILTSSAVRILVIFRRICLWERGFFFLVNVIMESSQKYLLTVFKHISDLMHQNVFNLKLMISKREFRSRISINWIKFDEFV